MPCRNDWNEPNYSNALLEQERRRTEWLEAALCAVMNLREKTELDPDDVYVGIDYKEAGITRFELERWWADHKVKDAERRKREAAEEKKKAEQKAREQARKKLIASLTPEQRDLLGIKK